MARFGMTIPLEGVPLHQQREWIEELVRLGYTDLWSSEATAGDGFTPLVLASVWAPSARLGTAIVPAFTRGPACLAQCVASLADAAPGRVVFGVGSSSDVIVERWNDVTFEKPFQRMRDTVRFLRRALAGEKIDEQYETFRVRGFRPGRVPADPPAIMIAALRPGMLRLAGRESDGAFLNWLSADDVKKVTPYVHEGGPDREIVARLFVCPTSSRETALAVGRRAIAAYLTVPVYAAFHDWLGRGPILREMQARWAAGDRRGALEAIPEEVVDALVINGPPDQCSAHIRRYVEAGVHTPVLQILPSELDVREACRQLAPR
jgi:probable F420-dependent oxidoreductase